MKALGTVLVLKMTKMWDAKCWAETLSFRLSRACRTLCVISFHWVGLQQRHPSNVLLHTIIFLPQDRPSSPFIMLLTFSNHFRSYLRWPHRLHVLTFYKFSPIPTYIAFPCCARHISCTSTPWVGLYAFYSPPTSPLVSLLGGWGYGSPSDDVVPGFSCRQKAEHR